MAANAKPNKEAPWPSSQHAIISYSPRSSQVLTHPKNRETAGLIVRPSSVLSSQSYSRSERLENFELDPNNDERMEGVTYRKGSHSLAGTLVGVNIHSSSSPEPISVDTHWPIVLGFQN